MPTIFLKNGFRFLFYSNERNEPCHVHVIGRSGEAKFWIPDLKVAYVYRLNAKDLKNILSILGDHIQEIKEKWDEFFKFGRK